MSEGSGSDSDAHDDLDMVGRSLLRSRQQAAREEQEEEEQGEQLEEEEEEARLITHDEAATVSAPA